MFPFWAVLGPLKALLLLTSDPATCMPRQNHRKVDQDSLNYHMKKNNKGKSGKHEGANAESTLKSCHQTRHMPTPKPGMEIQAPRSFSPGIEGVQRHLETNDRRKTCTSLTVMS